MYIYIIHICMYEISLQYAYTYIYIHTHTHMYMCTYLSASAVVVGRTRAIELRNPAGYNRRDRTDPEGKDRTRGGVDDLNPACKMLGFLNGSIVPGAQSTQNHGPKPLKQPKKLLFLILCGSRYVPGDAGFKSSRVEWLRLIDARSSGAGAAMPTVRHCTAGFVKCQMLLW